MARAQANQAIVEGGETSVRRARSKMRELKAALEAGAAPQYPPAPQVGNGHGEAQAGIAAPAATAQRPLGFSLITVMGLLWAGFFVAAAAITHFDALPRPILLFDEVVPLSTVPNYVAIPGFLLLAGLAAAIAIGFHRVHVWGWAGVVIATGFMALSGASDLVVSLVAGGPDRLVVETITGLPYLVAGALPFAYVVRARTRAIFASASSNAHPTAAPA